MQIDCIEPPPSPSPRRGPFEAPAGADKQMDTRAGKVAIDEPSSNRFRLAAGVALVWRSEMGRPMKSRSIVSQRLGVVVFVSRPRCSQLSLRLFSANQVRHFDERDISAAIFATL